MSAPPLSVAARRGVRPEAAVFLASAAIALLLALAGPSFDPGALGVALLAAAVAVVGLPHGGLDAWQAQRSGLVSPGWGVAVFHLLYLLAAVAVALLWLWQPALSLAGFLLISAWHFAGDWPPLAGPWRMLAGAALLGLPAWLWLQPVATVFGLLSGSGGVLLAEGLSALGPLFLLLLGAALWRLRQAPGAAIELGALAGLALLTPPLLFFAIYFCTLHSPRQLRLSLALAAPAQRRRLLAQAAVYAALAALLVLLAGLAVSGEDARAWLAQLDPEQGLRMLFIGLAALTVPHMGVAWLAARRSRESS